jgi:HSP20 family molecular chaperone IbpA
MDKLSIQNQFFRRMGDAYGHLIDAQHFLGRSPLEDTRLTRPSCSIQRTEDSYLIRLAMPGFQKNEIDLQLNGRQLYVKAEASAQAGLQENNYLHVEFMPDRQERRLMLPPDADPERMSATYELGLLQIRIARTPLPEKQAPVYHIPVY